MKFLEEQCRILHENLGMSVTYNIGRFGTLSGATRKVFLIGNYVVKIPRMASWRSFLNGLLANMQEREFSKTSWPELCPVVFSIPGGWLIVMPRTTPLNDTQWCSIHLDWARREEYTVPVELKRDSYGILNGHIVAVDYGS